MSSRKVFGRSFKKYGILSIAAVVAAVSIPSASAANYYWVGRDSANPNLWLGTDNWAATSGGAEIEWNNTPGTAHRVWFDANSGTPRTITLNGDVDIGWGEINLSTSSLVFSTGGWVIQGGTIKPTTTSGTQQYLGVSNFAGTNTIHSVIADNTRLDEETVIYDRRMGVWVTGRGTLVLTAANTYTSSTVIQGLRDFGGWEKLGFGTLKLDFSDPNAPTSNILYNGVAAGAFQSSGGTLLLQGKDGAANSQ